MRRHLQQQDGIDELHLGPGLGGCFIRDQFTLLIWALVLSKVANLGRAMTLVLPSVSPKDSRKSKLIRLPVSFPKEFPFLRGRVRSAGGEVHNEAGRHAKAFGPWIWVAWVPVLTL